MARPSIFVATPSIFESLILKQIDLYCNTGSSHLKMKCEIVWPFFYLTKLSNQVSGSCLHTSPKGTVLRATIQKKKDKIHCFIKHRSRNTRLSRNRPFFLNIISYWNSCKLTVQNICKQWSKESMLRLHSFQNEIKSFRRNKVLKERFLLRNKVVQDYFVTWHTR